ncbi:hypothetical protein FRC03_001102 [Tulasnella sp. 419]|nr:hypothetical protein FRC03_001102 [Tulasnella sp. 419]
MPRFRPRQRSLFGGIPSPEEFKELFPSLIPDDYFAYRDNSIDISTIHRLLRHLRNKADSLRDLLLKSSYTLPPTSGQTYLRPPSSTRRDEDEHSDFTDTADTQRPKSRSRRNSGNASGSRRASGRARGVSTSMLHELTFLPHPSQLQKSRELSNSTMCGVPVLELSRRVYALGDAFRNVVMKVQALNTDEAEEPFNTCGEGPGRNGVMTLMEMCVRIIGSDIETSVSERLEDACSDEEDIEKTGLVDYCYDKIPDHLKRWVVIPHVIQILFINIPRNIFTLWDMCLDSIIEHNAKADSITLLNRILRHALIPSCTLSRPLILSGPTDFLTRLMQKSNPTSPSKPVPISWSEAEFVSILIHTISQIPAKHVESPSATFDLQLHLDGPLSGAGQNPSSREVWS